MWTIRLGGPTLGRHNFLFSPSSLAHVSLLRVLEHAGIVLPLYLLVLESCSLGVYGMSSLGGLSRARGLNPHTPFPTWCLWVVCAINWYLDSSSHIRLSQIRCPLQAHVQSGFHLSTLIFFFFWNLPGIKTRNSHEAWRDGLLSTYNACYASMRSPLPMWL